ncbi:hypothetical protein BT96DRAFT_1051714 [Gymnopus androsaceus JB14]|uniref:Uncharacterized protein n=1 Tax=Gymnopus androsaceus JB14 TaxID=1447944 RepID=A0A6A4H6J2_9AGAR|nr:hypothetical protein BT96DRAFT_1051714 [Gymnopus androsaceus JB14]
MDRFNFHPFLTGEKCDKDGNVLPPGAPPEPLPEVENPWAPFQDEIAYRLADLVFKKVEMSQPNIDEANPLFILDGDLGPFGAHGDLLKMIDSIQDGSAPWQCFQTEIEENLPANAPEWRKTSYQVWYRNPNTVIANMLSNPNFTQIYKDPETGGENVTSALYCPIILGANKTTVSVATGHVEYHPLYLSIVDQKYNNDNNFCIFKKQLYHSSLVSILSLLRPAMTTPVVHQCPNGYFWHIIYDLAAFIADYPEQVMLAEWVNTLFNHYQGEPGVLWENYGIDDDVLVSSPILPFTHYFPRAKIHEILMVDLLHQVIKGCFKDMIVEWVVSYLTLEHGEAWAKEILDEVDHWCALPSHYFFLLRCFPHGHHFKQWTGDDSKTLMKKDFATNTIAEIQASIHSFHHYRKIFISTGIHEHFSIP